MINKKKSEKKKRDSECVVNNYYVIELKLFNERDERTMCIFY